MKTIVQNLKVTSSKDFTGMVEINGELVEIYGDFDVKWEDQYPEITNVWVTVWQPVGEASHSQAVVDSSTLVEQIRATDDGSWYDDYQSSLIERAQMRCEG